MYSIRQTLVPFDKMSFGEVKFSLRASSIKIVDLLIISKLKVIIYITFFPKKIEAVHSKRLSFEAKTVSIVIVLSV